MKKFLFFVILCGNIFGESEPHVIDSILKLKDGAPIPSKTLESYDTRSIGESIVYRLSDKEERSPQRERVPYDLSNDTQLILRFPASNTEKILQDGFLNQHQTGSSGAIYSPHQRRARDTELMEVQVPVSEGDSRRNPGNALLPKYAILNFSKPGEAWYPVSAGGGYGDIGAVMKDQVKLRATWTYSDSFSLGHEISPEVRRTFYHNSVSPQLMMEPSRYREAQIFGELDLRDVERFLVLWGKVPPALRKTGIPVYEMEIQRPKGRGEIITTGRLLVSGDPSKMWGYQTSLENAFRAPPSKERARSKKCGPTLSKIGKNR